MIQFPPPGSDVTADLGRPLAVVRELSGEHTSIGSSHHVNRQPCPAAEGDDDCVMGEPTEGQLSNLADGHRRATGRPTDAGEPFIQCRPDQGSVRGPLVISSPEATDDRARSGQPVSSRVAGDNILTIGMGEYGPLGPPTGSPHQGSDGRYKTLQDIDLRAVNDTNRVLRTIFDVVAQAGRFNHEGPRVPLPSAMNIGQWRTLLQGYSDFRVVDYLEFGWPIGIDREAALLSYHKNHPSANTHPRDVGHYIATELGHGALLGPFAGPPPRSAVTTALS